MPDDPLTQAMDTAQVELATAVRRAHDRDPGHYHAKFGPGTCQHCGHVTDRSTNPVLVAIAETLRMVAVWDGNLEAADLERLAAQVEAGQVDHWADCPMCGGAVCDEGCPLAGARATPATSQRRLVAIDAITGQPLAPDWLLRGLIGGQAVNDDDG